MLIGNDECYLRIERADAHDWYSPYRLEARLRYGDRAEFFALNTLAMVSAGEQERVAFVDFAELRSHRVLFALSDEGSLELRRDARGNIDVLFTIGYRRVGPHWKTSGDVRVDGEYTQNFLHDFGKLVFPTTT